ncbi:polyprenyl synthetase family protein [Ahrensia sp. AH-315-G08]|nr:polyprenyl synthetase family protein [Ahrensia sp. AH-315-G08]
MASDFRKQFRTTADHVNTQLNEILSNDTCSGERARPPLLLDAMRHGALNGGKRIRPFLLIQTAALFGVSEKQAMTAACALECLHCYSLIHDDLPAMDDDDLRRGQPTVHKAYDDATAILAGDALNTLAFELLSDNTCHPNAEIRMLLVQMLARAAGIGGMVGGQIFDIEAQTKTADETQILLLQAMKTGALLKFSCEAGAILGGAAKSQVQALARFGEIIGLAYQLSDDLLDETASTEQMGKATGKDAAQGKGTLVALLGRDEVRKRLDQLIIDADDCLVEFGDKADTLRQTARFIVEREN